jgi:hypothetical protein
LFSRYTNHINRNPNTSQPRNPHPLSVVRRSFLHIILCSINFQMSEEQQQNLKDYPYEAVPLSNTVPSMAHNPTTMPRDSIVSRSTEKQFLFEVKRLPSVATPDPPFITNNSEQ